MTSKNDAVCDKVFDELKVLDSIDSHGFVLIPARTLKEVGRREPRIMAKQETPGSLARIF